MLLSPRVTDRQTAIAVARYRSYLYCVLVFFSLSLFLSHYSKQLPGIIDQLTAAEEANTDLFSLTLKNSVLNIPNITEQNIQNIQNIIRCGLCCPHVHVNPNLSFLTFSLSRFPSSVSPTSPHSLLHSSSTIVCHFLTVLGSLSCSLNTNKAARVLLFGCIKNQNCQTYFKKKKVCLHYMLLLSSSVHSWLDYAFCFFVPECVSSMFY